MGCRRSGDGPALNQSVGGGDDINESLLQNDDFNSGYNQEQTRMQNNQEQIMRREEVRNLLFLGDSSLMSLNLCQRCLVTQDIMQIESTVADIAEIMQDLAVIVHSQDGLIDNIESAVENTEQKTREAGSELRKVRRCSFCLPSILVLTHRTHTRIAPVYLILAPALWSGLSYVPGGRLSEKDTQSDSGSVCDLGDPHGYRHSLFDAGHNL